MTTRAAALGLALAILLAVMTQAVELLTAGQYIVSNIPAPGPIALLFVAALLLLPLSRLLGRGLQFDEAEFRTAYAMLLVAGPVCAATALGAVPFAVMGPYLHATPENRWPELLWPLIPGPLRMPEGAAETFARGGADGVPWGLWARPLATYAVFFLLLYLLYFSVAAILRREWEDHEKLAFPLAQIPLWLARHADRRLMPDVFYNPIFWLCFALPMLTGSLNALHAMLPQVPNVAISGYSLGPLLREPPWDILAMYGISIGINFTVVGVAFLVPREVSFSVWFFYIAGALLYVAGKAMGVSTGDFGTGISRFPLFTEQRTGAIVALFAVTVWLARHHLRTVLAGVFRGAPLDDAGEPLPYRWAAAGFAAALLGLVLWKLWLGAQWPAAIAATAFLLITAVALARIRAEVGLPAPGDVPTFADTSALVLGSAALSAQTRAVEAYTWFTNGLNEFSRSQPLASMVEGYRVAPGDQARQRRLTTLLFAWTVPVAAIVTLGLGLTMIYHLGGENLDWIRQRAGHSPFGALVGDLRTERAPDNIAALFMGIGALMFWFIWFMRTRYAFWPFHPIGFLLALDTWGLADVWFSVLAGWLLRRVAQSYGGRTGYQLLLPAVLGLITGDMVARVVWSTIGAALGKGYIPVS